MKKLTVLIVSGMFAGTLLAQQKEILNPSLMKRSTEFEYFKMKEKQVWHYKDSIADPLTEDVILNNGAIITPKGEVISKDGKKRTSLTDGQCVDIGATITNCENLRPVKKEESVKKEVDKR